MTVWGTFILDAGQEDAKDMADALEALFAPTSGTTWGTAGIYLFWDVGTREVLYVGLATDLPIRFAQHNSLRSCRPESCKKIQLAEHLDRQGRVGYTVLPLSNLTQPETARMRVAPGYRERELLDLREALDREAMDEIRSLEGALIATCTAMNQQSPRWNVSRGRVPPTVHATDGTIPIATGQMDCLLQARRTLRELAGFDEAGIFEEHLHGVRLVAVRSAILGAGFGNELIRTLLATEAFSFYPGDAILASDYLDHRNPLTVGPVLDP